MQWLNSCNHSLLPRLQTETNTRGLVQLHLQPKATKNDARRPTFPGRGGMGEAQPGSTVRRQVALSTHPVISRAHRETYSVAVICEDVVVDVHVE